MVTFIARWGFAPTVRVPRMAHLVEVPKLFYRRHPKIGMEIELVIQPRGPGLLRADTKKIRPHRGIGFSRCRVAGRIPFCKQSADVHYRFYLTCCCEKSKGVHQHACAGRWGVREVADSALQTVRLYARSRALRKTKRVSFLKRRSTRRWRLPSRFAVFICWRQSIYPCLARRRGKFLTFAATRPCIGRDLAYIGCRTVHRHRWRVGLMSSRSALNGRICYAVALCLSACQA